MPEKPPDAVDAAIAAALDQVELSQVQVRLAPHGRPALIALPPDVTAEEILAAVVAVLQFAGQLRAQQPASRIAVAKAMPGL